MNRSRGARSWRRRATAVVAFVACVAAHAAVARTPVPDAASAFPVRPAAERARAAAAAPMPVFAAASLQGVLDDVAADWTRRTGRRVSLVYAASSTLARQIDQGAPADVYFSADRHWMDWLAQRGRIDAATRADVLGNTLVLIAPRVAPPGTRASDVPAAGSPPAAWLPGGLGARGRLAVADVYTVPAGRYAKQALQAIGRWDAVADRLAMGDNVRAALAFVARGEAPLGIVYATDARAEPGVRVVATFPDDTHAPIVYPVAAVAGAGRDAASFVGYLQSSPEAGARFRAAGFRPLASAARSGADPIATAPAARPAD